jgi:epoxide hydrolase
MRAFQAHVSEDALADLRQRLATTRWPEPATVGDWRQGVPVDWLRQLCAYWADGYDWRRLEARLNALSQIVTEIDVLDIHAIHVRSPHPGALPLILTHGWPGSVVEFLDVLEPLTSDPHDPFHVVCPSLPGSGSAGNRPSRDGTWRASRAHGCS